jgi:hypothetical protein
VTVVAVGLLNKLVAAELDPSRAQAAASERAR